MLYFDEFVTLKMPQIHVMCVMTLSRVMSLYI